jgi:EAL domain-containing protein (putative c-di-GMP-specific phosphodiesterase class I)
VAGRIIASLAHTFTLEGRDVLIGASVGVASLTDAEQSAAELLSEADVAMYCAKRSGRGRWMAFEPRMHTEVDEQLSLRTDLGGALAAGQLSLAYQPIVDMTSGMVSGVEALLRWNHPVRGQVPPSVFIPIAEESDTILALGEWAIERGLAALAAWRRELPELHLALNISGRQITDPRLPGMMAAALDRWGLPGRAVTLEITESVLMSDPELACRGLEALEALGMRLSVDDFGTGYSSLSYLRQFPVDQVKIDRSFVAELRAGADNEISLVRSILDLCRSLRLQTVAEGIEDAEQLAVLTDLGCDLGQGYHFARPRPAEEHPYRLPAPAGRAGRSQTFSRVSRKAATAS